MERKLSHRPTVRGSDPNLIECKLVPYKGAFKILGDQGRGSCCQTIRSPPPSK